MREREIYEVVEHDGGWTYRVGGTYVETFRTRDAAERAALHAARAQSRPGSTTGISYEDEKGEWHDEVARGDDRPDITVER